MSNQAVSRSWLERVLGVFAPVAPREGTTAVLLIANIFLILAAYYFIKPLREGWLAVSVLSGLSSLEIKAYAAFGQTLLLMAILPLYAALAARWTRRALILRVGGLFGVLLVVFWLLQPEWLFARVPYVGIVFYLFVGVFSVTLVAQFWSFASDIYGREQGKRLFPLIAIGASAGAVVGSGIGERLITSGLVPAFDLIACALLPLGVALALAAWVDRRGASGTDEAGAIDRRSEPAAPSNAGAYRQIAQHRYLALAALMTMLFSWVIASGDNILFYYVQESLRQAHGSVTDKAAYDRLINTATTAFYGDLFFWINLIGLLLQAFIVSRVVRYAGFGTLLLITPLVSLGAYATMLVMPALGVIKVLKIAENASNYSVNNTARHMLWLPTTKEMLYQSKPVIDTLFVRLGDGLAALTVLLGSRVWTFGALDYVALNLVLVGLWVIVAGFVVVENRRWNAMAAAGASPPHADGTS